MKNAAIEARKAYPQFEVITLPNQSHNSAMTHKETILPQAIKFLKEIEK